MRGVLALAAVSVAFGAFGAFGAGVLACFDLFHSTGDILTACEIDAQAPDCGADAGQDVDAEAGAADAPVDAVGMDFCTWMPSEARAHAQHACAWLGACETPMGGNTLGSCLLSALLAYDCKANPNHRVQGKTHQLWDCLWRVGRCPDVERCIFSQGSPQPCAGSGDSTGCGTSTADGAITNLDVRTRCIEGGANQYGENCALWGKTCASNGAEHACAGHGGLGIGCAARGCFGAPYLNELGWCDNGSDIGVDCASIGQQCGRFNDPAGATPWVACAVAGGAPPCIPDASASCANGVAASCLSGALEKIDCAALLQADAACVAGPLDPPFDWTSACAVTPPRCTADSCTVDGDLVGCVRGAPVPIHCVEAGLGPCQPIPGDSGAAGLAACAPP